MDVARASQDKIRRDYSRHRGQDDSSGQASGRGDEEGVYLDELLEKDLLWAEGGDRGDVGEDALVATWNIITDEGQEIPVSKKGYVDLRRSLAAELQATRRESKARSCELDIQRPNVEQLELKVPPLTAAAERAVNLQKTLSAKEAELVSKKAALETKKIALKAKVRDCDKLNYDWGSAQAVVGREERVIRAFAERVCIRYASTRCAQTSSYRYCLNTLLTDLQLRGEHLNGYQVRVADNGYSLLFAGCR